MGVSEEIRHKLLPRFREMGVELVPASEVLEE